MASILTYTGKEFDFADAGAAQIDIKDISHSLSNICRWNGHTKRFYSVAEHSVHLARYALQNGAGKDAAILCLLHDAPEAYLGDVTRPLKKELGDVYKNAEERIWGWCIEKFCLGPILHHMEYVHSIDDRIIVDEREQALARPPADFVWQFQGPKLGIQIYFWEAHTATSKYLEMWHILGRME